MDPDDRDFWQQLLEEEEAFGQEAACRGAVVARDTDRETAWFAGHLAGAGPGGNAPQTEEQGMKVYQAINAVMRDLATEGIGKHRRNTQQGYSFRGIDDVYNALSSALSRHGLVMLPRILNRSAEERATARGGVLFYVTIEAEFDLVAVEDGSTHTIRTWGEAMDSADKATNKAMSAAYKYAAMQAFCIPTEGDNDADASTHEVTPATREAPPEWMTRMETTIRNAESRAKLEEIRAYLKERQLPVFQTIRLSRLIDDVAHAMDQAAAS